MFYFGVHMKPARLIKMYLNETYEYSKVRRGVHVTDSFPITEFS
jgi:hypothetical protein